MSRSQWNRASTLVAAAVLASALLTSLPPARGAEETKGPFAVRSDGGGLAPAIRYRVFALIAETFRLSDRTFYPEPLNPKGVVPRPWADVPPDLPEYAAVEAARRHGVAAAFPDATFKGRRPVTRYEWAAILQTLAGALFARAEQPGCPFLFDRERAKPLRAEPFPDVPDGHEALKAVEELRLRGVFPDRPEFAGLRPITKTELEEDVARLAALFRARPAP